jgi:multiple sugar transport system substrate-binding protein
VDINSYKKEERMKKKLISALLAATMVVGLTACGNSTSSNSNGSSETGSTGSTSEDGVTTENITLTYWHYEDETTIDLLAEKFMELYPNITVETKVISDMSTDLSAAAAAGTFPDVFSGTDSDTALANMYWADITDYVENDPETANLMATIEEYGIGKFDTSVRFAMPTYFQPSAIFIDKNVIDKLNLEMPRTDWTWAEMIQLIKDATVDDRSGMKYFGLGYYNRLDSLYGIAACSNAERAIKGEFGYDGTDFDLSYWAIGEQEFSDLKLAGYVAPQQNTQEMEDWSGDWSTWFGASGHVAVFSEGFWSYMNLWGTDGYQDTYGLDIVPYVTPNVVDEKEHNVISTMYMGGVSTSCEHPYEAYLLLKFMGWGVDGWNARMDIYEDESITNSSGVALKHSNMPVPITLDEGVWARYRALFPTDEEHAQYWDDYFDSITRPVPYGWYSIAGYWNFCDQYFNSIGIHDLVDQGKAKAADYAAEATEQANYYHAEAMISYFGPSGYNVLSDDELAQYQAVVDSFAQ